MPCPDGARGALAWTAAIGGTLALILLLKLRFFACGYFLPDSGVGNPSSHTAAAAAVYGGLVAMILRFIWNDGRWAFFCAVTTGVLLAVVIGRSRVILDTHSMAEVVVGGAIYPSLRNDARMPRAVQTVPTGTAQDSRNGLF